MGGSQAGWIVPLAAPQANIAFFILLVGPTVSVGEEIYYSDLAEGTSATFDELSAKLAQFKGSRGFDPRPVLAALQVPGLWLLGADDRSIPTRETVAILDGLVASGKPFSRVVYPGQGHQLRVDFWADIDRWLSDLK